MGHLLRWGLSATAPLLGGVTLEGHKGQVAIFWTRKGPLWPRWHRAGGRVLSGPAHRLPSARVPLGLTVQGADGETEAGGGWGWLEVSGGAAGGARPGPQPPRTAAGGGTPACSRCSSRPGWACCELGSVVLGEGAEGSDTLRGPFSPSLPCQAPARTDFLAALTRHGAL